MSYEEELAALLSECQRLPVVGLTRFGVEPVGIGRDVAEQVQRVSCKEVVPESPLA